MISTSPSFGRQGLCTLEESKALQKGSRIRRFGTREEIVLEGERPRDVQLLISGWACQYKTMEDGRRQVVAFLLPGDVWNINMAGLQSMDSSIATLTDVTLAEISPWQVDQLVSRYPGIRRVIAWHWLSSAALEREWLTNLGQRQGRERIANLLCEIFVRLDAAGETDGDSCAFPVTQADLADAAGMTAVHINRVLQDLRHEGLIVLKGRRLRVPSLPALEQVAGFEGHYLRVHDHLVPREPMRASA